MLSYISNYPTQSPAPPTAVSSSSLTNGPTSSSSSFIGTRYGLSLEENHASNLAAITHIPSGLLLASRSRPRLVSKGAKKKLRDCEIVSKTFNTVASRPVAMPAVRNKVYYANLRLDAINVLLTSITVPSYGASSFALNDFVNRTEYTGLFDQYRIEEFEIWIEPIVSQSTVISNLGYVSTAIDLDDSTTPTAVSQVEGKQNAITTSALDGHYHRWKPHMAIAAYSGVFTSFASVPAGWIDSGSPSVQHYGVKFASSPTSVAIQFNAQLRARVAFRQAGI